MNISLEVFALVTGMAMRISLIKINHEQNAIRVKAHVISVNLCIDSKHDYAFTVIYLNTLFYCIRIYFI